MKKELDYHSKLIIYDLPNLNGRIIEQMQKWLRKIAKDIKKKELYSTKYTAKLMK